MPFPGWPLSVLGFFIEDKKMKTHEFFVCQHCGNTEIFRVFTGNFQVVVQSAETGTRIDESCLLPSLRTSDNFVECQLCFKRTEREVALLIGRKYIDKHQKLSKTATALRHDAYAPV